MATISPADILVTGSGSLASALLHVLASASTEPLVIVIASRASERLTWLRTSVEATANGAGGDAFIETADLNWSMESLRTVVGKWRFKVVVHTASLQSPWSLNGSDGWSRLVRAAGYGFTLPLHFALARRIAGVLRAMDEDILFINACYPDAVNPLLAAEGLPVVSGIGNVATLAALLSGSLVPRSRDLQLIAHHCHVAEAISGLPPSDEFHAWLDGVAIDEAAKTRLQGIKVPKGSELNQVTAASAFGVLMALLGRSAPQHASLPGTCQ